MDLSVEIGGVTFEHPVMNAAGTVKTVEDVEKMAATSVSAIMVGSGTVLPRTGNSGRVYYYDEQGQFSLNSLGLPNGGIEYYRERLPEMREIADKHEKRLVFSAAGFTAEEYAALTEMASERGAHAVEINFGCPNVLQGQILKPVICFDLELVDDSLALSFSVAKVPIWVKPSPYSNPAEQIEFVKVVRRHVVAALTGTNTWPSASAYDSDGKPAIDAADGYAGMAGPALKPGALGNIRRYRKELPNQMLVGAGGIRSGRDVLDYQHAGASLVQIAAAFFQEGHSVFLRVLTELVDLLEA